MKTEHALIPIKCILCDDVAAAIIHAPEGCTCAANRYQPRCAQHLIRASDAGEVFEVVEELSRDEYLFPKREEAS